MTALRKQSYFSKCILMLVNFSDKPIGLKSSILSIIIYYILMTMLENDKQNRTCNLNINILSTYKYQLCIVLKLFLCYDYLFYNIVI